MAESITSRRQSGDDYEFSSTLTVVGFACFWAWNMIVAVSGAFSPMGDVGLAAVLLPRLVAAGAFTATLYVTYKWIVGRLTSASASRWLPLAILLLAIPVVVTSAMPELHEAATLAATIPAWFCAGVSSALLVLLWGNVWSTLDSDRADNRTSALVLALSIFGAAVFCLFTIFAPRGVATGAAYVLYVFSVTLYTVCSRRLPLPTQIDPETSVRRLKLYSRSRFTPITVGIALGLVLGHSVAIFGFTSAFVLTVAAVAVGGAAAGAAIAAFKRVPRISSVERILFPVLGAAILLLPFVTGRAQWAASLVAVSTLVTFLVFHWNVLVALSYRYHVLPIFHYAQGAVTPVGGFTIGLGVQILLNALGVPLSSSLLVTCLLFAFVLIAEPAFVPYMSDKVVEITDRSDRTKRALLADESGGYWKKRCIKVAEDHQLTPREREVFMMLARGRNTEIIHQELVISTHTVKTHTYRIYRKLNISSQQELIDLVERAEVDE